MKQIDPACCCDLPLILESLALVRLKPRFLSAPEAQNFKRQHAKKGEIVDFILANWMLILVALASGSMLLWPAMSGGAGLGAVTPAQAVQAMNREKAVVVDVRDAAEFAAQHVQGAKNIPLVDLAAKLSTEVKNKTVPVIIVCASGNRSRRAAMVAKQQGFENAQSLAGGFKAWLDAGLPVAKG